MFTKALGSMMPAIDFDRLAALAVSDPEAFEAERQRILEAEISQGNEWQQAKARKLLTTYEKRTYGQDRLEVASVMMLESLTELRQHLNNLTGQQ